ncbi:kinase-like protein [Ramicandelaber brevisporus]|nr:kinase-like protein [Ramicandelaber brevisporus]
MIQDDPEKMLTIMAQTAQAIQHVHSLDIVHLDVKPANVLVTSEDATPSGLSTVSIHLRLSDFGLAARLPIRQGAEYEGDRDYLAPEVLMYGRVSKAADIFSFGIMMFEILTDLNVPDCGDNYLLLRSGDLSWCDEFMQVLNSDNRVVAEIAEMARQMLLPDPEHRPTVGAIVQRCEALRQEL